MLALHAAVDAGMNFIDTADVYGDGRSERLVARLRRERLGERIWVATKARRRAPAQTAAALPPLGGDVMGAVRVVYETRIRPHVHARW